MKEFRTDTKLPQRRYGSLSYTVYCLSRQALPEQFCVSPYFHIQYYYDNNFDAKFAPKRRRVYNSRLSSFLILTPA